MLNATRFALRLVTESAYLCLDLGISLCVTVMRGPCRVIIKGVDCLSAGRVQRLMTA